MVKGVDFIYNIKFLFNFTNYWAAFSPQKVQTFKSFF